jgi:hypothetical protein
MDVTKGHGTVLWTTRTVVSGQLQDVAIDIDDPRGVGRPKEPGPGIDLAQKILF